MIWTYPTNAQEAPVYSRIISWTNNGKRGRGKSTSTWKEFVKRDSKD
jgi:hypothetical protein